MIDEKKYKKIEEGDILFFKSFLEENQVDTSDFGITTYSSDATEKLSFPPAVIVFPRTSEEVSKIVRYCNENKIPITPRAGGTGLVGGALSIYKGVLLSVKNLNKIINIDVDNFQATVESGVINYDLQQELAKNNLFYPPDPSSWQSSFIGGNIATNAGGTKAVKYGVTSAYVMNLEVVLPNGEIIWTGFNTLKNSTGINLTQLFVGSEGTLGIITKAVLKVQTKPKEEVSVLIPFHSVADCAKAVSEIFHHNLNPCVLELMERNALEQTIKHTNENNIPLNDKTQAHLLVMFDGENQEELMISVEKLMLVLDKYSTDEVFFADNDTDKNRIWNLRRRVAEVVKVNGYTIEEDTVVPRAKLPELIHFAHQLAKKYSFDVVCYGHAGDGNLHVRINHPKYKNSYNEPEVKNILVELFTYIKSIGGTISGEHGIGLIQKEFLPIVFSEENLRLQNVIKESIDRNNIMNPGKSYLV
ncbi:MAG: FAD-binding protein [Flavobacteriales bacterium]|nr:FAD-binding protein [Flavobacteriales bacterium]